jgi:peptide chain release factor 2
VRKIRARFDEIRELHEMALHEKDEHLLADLEKNFTEFEREYTAFEDSLILSGKDDACNAFLNIHAGAGGTEACDWADMLLRMYTRWCDIKKCRYEYLDYQPGTEAGIKSATLRVIGEYAYGQLKAEIGVHRLVRISPFDANKRRHTSFASVDVTPEIESDIKIEILDKDLRIDTYRSSGSGGQHVNKTDSAVRITHIPTNTIVQCQSERSQIQNRETAMKMLRSKLYKQEEDKRFKEKMEREGKKMKIEWGSQIRSYVFHPYTLVKDHRTGIETGNGQAVMDGELDKFIIGYLKQFKDID